MTDNNEQPPQIPTKSRWGVFAYKGRAVVAAIVIVLVFIKPENAILLFEYLEKLLVVTQSSVGTIISNINRDCLGVGFVIIAVAFLIRSSIQPHIVKAWVEHSKNKLDHQIQIHETKQLAEQQALQISNLEEQIIETNKKLEEFEQNSKMSTIASKRMSRQQSSN
jgi:hypothetical protein